jgi:hypothetical protein
MIKVKKIQHILLVLVIMLLVSVTSYAATIIVTWDANTESDLAGYGVYDNGVLAGSTGVLATPTFSILNAVDGIHAITLDAFDITGNRSLKSDAVSINIDTVSPVKPAKPTIVVTGNSAKLTWIASTDTDLAGYGIYYDGVLVGSVGVMASPTYTLSSLSDGSHVFTIDSVDTAGNRSIKSEPTTINIDSTAPTKPKNVKITYTK